MSSTWRRLAAALLAASLFVFGGLVEARAPGAVPEVALGELPAEARQAIAQIRKGGPFRYERDGATFGNFEGRLPVKARGYYREYTVRTPGAKNRGARRIVAGKGGELYYTDDHYQNFKRVRESP